MNALEIYIRECYLSQTLTMNTLQDNNVISDNYVFAGDVADSDCIKAVDFLNEAHH